jgi:ABC-type sugar transport system ATPase subunit
VATLSFRGVDKCYGAVEALRGLDLDVADGEIVTIVGPSGCGKSSALRVAAGLEAVSAGSVHIGERDVTQLAPAERNVSMVFQNYALFPHLSVAENIGFGLRVRKVPKAHAAGRVADAARTVGCGELLDRRPFELSGGERQRVALARALVREPDVFLLDEPLSNLDAQLRVQMRAELQRLHLSIGATMLYVTHDQVEALTLGHRVAVLRAGVVQQFATPDEIYWRPANRFVATFVGSPSMNVVPAAVAGGEIHAGPFRVPLDGEHALAGRALEIGVRPEHLDLCSESDARRSGAVAAVVQFVEVAGNEAFIHVVADSTALIVKTTGDIRPAPGATLHVAIPRDRLYVFDTISDATVVHAR